MRIYSFDHLGPLKKKDVTNLVFLKGYVTVRLLEILISFLRVYFY